MNARFQNRRLRTRVNKRKIWLGITAGSLVFVILTASLGAERIGRTVVLYVRIARLYTEPPDRKLAVPLEDVRKDQIANTWHAARGDHRHEGQDIFAARGTPIYSATKGYVYNVGENNLGGNTVSVIGAGGRVYYYAHLDSYARDIAEGDYITTRTVLGYVGTTGNAAGTPPHLHFGIYGLGGGAIDPLPLLSDRPSPNAAAKSTQPTRRGSPTQNGKIKPTLRLARKRKPETKAQSR